MNKCMELLRMDNFFLATVYFEKPKAKKFRVQNAIMSLKLSLHFSLGRFFR